MIHTCIKMDKEKWKSMMLPRSVVEQLEVFAKSKLANSLGYTNKSQIAALAIRDYLRKTNLHTAYIDFIDVDGKIITLMDYQLDKTIQVIIDNEKLEIRCEQHGSKICNHTNFLRGLPRFEKILEKYPFKEREPRIKIPKVAEYSDKSMIDNIKRVITRPVNQKGMKLTKKQQIKILNQIIQETEQE